MLIRGFEAPFHHRGPAVIGGDELRQRPAERTQLAYVNDPKAPETPKAQHRTEVGAQRNLPTGFILDFMVIGVPLFIIS